MAYKLVAGLSALLTIGGVCGAEKSCPNFTDLIEPELEQTCISDYVSVMPPGESKSTMVAYEILPSDVWRNPQNRDYIVAKDLSQKTIMQRKNAKELGWDFGHLANEKVATSDVKSRFLAPNRVPMPKHLNRQNGSWHELERYEVDIAKQIGKVGVVAGHSISESTGEHIYFKVYVSRAREATAAYLMTETSQRVPLLDLITSVECVEEHIGHAIFTRSNETIDETYDDFAFSPMVWTAGNTPLSTCSIKGDVQ